MALTISGINVSSRGTKSALIFKSEERFSHVFEQPVECVFQPGSYDRDDAALRQNVVFRPTQEMEQFFDELDQWAVDYLTEHSERLFGKTLSKDTIKFGYVPVLKRPEGKLPLVKFKINMPGSQKPLRCWNENKEPADFIQDWAGRSMQLKILVSHLWIMGSGGKAEFGFVCLLTDVMAMKQQAVMFPF